ncbi:hypothetical protein BLD48_13590 [Exiguobacterium sp. KRL4]|uniref:hypothetical protein n=1 Tax=Exiguobacterium sp. KRL4 TaxID=1914536 RepID=UPI0008F8AD46|nr:hypothetical protein [Exiguobacterium sp. KRL4]OIN65960.1 hypothetical protein BLD48_13590 [Exiguobacterium sp. KRL4]
MGPHEIIEAMMLFAVVIPIIVLGMKLKTKSRGRVLMFSLAGVICIAYGAYLMIYPYYLDQRSASNAEQVEMYLEKTYPGERWTTMTVPYWEEQYKHLNPYKIDVVFGNEPDAVYTYTVNDKGNVELVGFSTKNDKDNFRHLEEKRVINRKNSPA